MVKELHTPPFNTEYPIHGVFLAEPILKARTITKTLPALREEPDP